MPSFNQGCWRRKQTALPSCVNRTKEGSEFNKIHFQAGQRPCLHPSPCSSGMQAVHRGKTSPSSAAQLPVDAALNAHSLTLLIFWQSGGRDGPFRPGGRHPSCRGGRRQADGLHCLYYTRFAAGVQGAGRTSFPMERPSFRARCPESAAVRQKKNGGPCRLGRRFALAGRQGK